MKTNVTEQKFTRKSIVNLGTKQTQNGNVLNFSLENDQMVMNLAQPICVEFWDEVSGVKSELTSGYSEIVENPDNLVGQAILNTENGKYQITDSWKKIDSSTWKVDRRVVVNEGKTAKGFRLRLDFVTAFKEGASYTDLKYFIPPALYDKNDTNEDGLEDYYGTQNQMYREDRLNSLSVMAYHDQDQVSISLSRADIPEFDHLPNRPNKEVVFLQKTDIGSLGIWNIDGEKPQMSLRATYPFFEGEKSHALLFKDRIGWEAYWPAETGEVLEMSYHIRIQYSENFAEAMWNDFTQQIDHLNPPIVPLPATAEELTHYRLESLNRYFVEKNSNEDPNAPAGYVLNCHPQDGKQISNIIQFGFTGQNLLSAYNTMRYGYQMGNGDYIQKARKIVDFFATKAHIKESGMFYNLYNLDSGKFSFWWTGLLLPLAYAEGEELERLMGPLTKFMDHVIDGLKSQQGSYLRCMNEDAEALLRVYEYELQLGNEHGEWLETAKRYGEFLLRSQEPDGTWYRAYDITGKPITDPEIWFGACDFERKSSTGTSIPFLLKLYEITNDKRYLEASIKAGKYVKEFFVDDVKYSGGIHDSIYAKGPLIDHESIYYIMVGLLQLYKITNEDLFIQGAIEAARISASWSRLWDVPLPRESTLAKYGLQTTGLGGADTASAGYVHPMEIVGVPEIAEIAMLSGDEYLLRVAEITWHGCNQTVQVPGKDWGYAYNGLQEEGYLISWWGADDPMFEGTGFGQRGKGEGNKTCFPWITAVAVASYWKLMDQFNTADFSAIRKKFNRSEK